MMKKKTNGSWEKRIEKVLLNRTIVSVRYMHKEEAEQLGWRMRAIVLVLDDGNLIYPSSDDEGNNAGAIFTNATDLQTIPVCGMDG